MGVIAFALLFGRPPFETNDVKTTYEKIKLCEYSFPNSNVSAAARNFVGRMLRLHPADRATIEQLLADDFLALSQIPRTLPLSTLACPPSRAFLEAVALNHRTPSESKESQHEEFEGVSTSRTGPSEKAQCLLASERFESIRNHKSRKSERSAGSITRAISTAAMTRKQVGEGRLWVAHFEEHAKYGVFYLLSNGAVGMRFNDITCLLTTPTFKKFKYVALKNNSQEAELEVFDAGQEREALAKKIKILSHFYRELKGRAADSLGGLKGREGPLGAYVTAHFSTSHYTLFWLSNSHFHAKFKDDSEMLVEAETLTYLGKDKREVSFRLDRISSAAEEIRYKFSHLDTLIKKIKRNRPTHPEGKEEMKDRPA